MKTGQVTEKVNKRLTKAIVKDAIKDSGGIILTIAKKCGVAWNTMKDYINKHDDLKQLLFGEEEKIKDLAEGNLFDAISNKDLSAIKFFLATKGKDRGYSTSIETKQNITSTLTLKASDIEKLTDEQLEKLAGARIDND